MAKKATITAQTVETYQIISKVERRLSDLYGRTYQGVLQLSQVRNAIAAGQPFTFEKNRPETKALIKSLDTLSQRVDRLLQDSVTLAWQKGEDSVTNACYSAFGRTAAGRDAVRAIADRAREDLRGRGVSAGAFYTQKHGGLNISDRVWGNSLFAKQEIEEIIQQGILQGKSADEISRSVRGYLNNPSKLFRRVRNKETGELELSKNAKNYHPGRGVYRSSYQNALRLARTEVNAAYRRAEWESYQNNPLITGYRIELSNNHTTTIRGKKVVLRDICDDMAGEYPKTFQWTGWHPQCRCRMVPIFIKEGDFRARIRALAAGKLDEWKASNTVTEPPKAFTDWVAENADRLKAGKQMPYFIADNYVGGDPTKGLVKAISGLKQEVKQSAQKFPEPVTKYDAQIATMKKNAARYDIDASALDRFRDSGNEAGLLAELDRIEAEVLRRDDLWEEALNAIIDFKYNNLREFPELAEKATRILQAYAKLSGKTYTQAVAGAKKGLVLLQNQLAAAKAAKVDLTKDYAKKVDAATTVQEVKQLFGARLKQVLGYDVKLDFSEKTITLDIVKTYAKRYIELCQEYTLEMPCTKVQFKKLSGVYGQVSWLNAEGKRAKYGWEIKAKCQNTGPAVAESRAQEVATGKSRCDKDKLQVSTLTHEFGHNICVDGVNRSENARAFITELKTVRDAYYKEIRGLTKGSKEYNDIYLGDYADTNIDEFLAEGFQEYKNRATPSKYAKQVGELVDKYFKKKK